MITAGIDAGSRAIKIVVADGDGGPTTVLARAAADQGVRQDVVVAELMQRVLAEAGMERSDVTRVIATGYGRNLVAEADATVTEITCHARGVRAGVPDAQTVVEIGGQDSKIIHVGEDGAVYDFAMNDRCAAGTGRFIEVVAARLGVGLDELGELAGRSRRPATISSMCVVFAETEIVGLLASGAAPEDIVAGVLGAIARRVAGMAGRRVVAPVVFTGGVARVPGMDAALAEALGKEVVIAPDPQYTGALGAAIVARSDLPQRARRTAETE